MGVKIFSRNLFIKNLMIFVLLSFFFLYFVENFKHPRFFSDLGLLKEYALSNLLVFTITLLLTLSIFFLLKWSRYLFLVFCTGVFLYSIRVYFLSSSAAILPLSLIYMMCAYYFYTLFSEELKGALYLPNFVARDINPVPNKKLKILLRKNDNSLIGYLLNWDSRNVFVYLNDQIKLRGKVNLEMHLDGSVFCFEGKIVTAYNKGYGIKVTDSASGVYGWEDLYQILLDRGYNQQTKE